MKERGISYEERRLSDGTTAALGTRPDARQSHGDGPDATEVPVYVSGAPEREEGPSCGSTVADALRILGAKPGESLVDACRRVVSEGIRRELWYEAQLQAARLHAELSDAALATECETAAAALADEAGLRARIYELEGDGGDHGR